MTFVRFYTEPAFDVLNREFDQTVGKHQHPKNHGNQEARSEANWQPRVDISENDDAFIMVADVPGLTKKDIEIGYDQGLLTISGERKQPEGLNTIFSERRYGKFSRSFRVKTPVDINNIVAVYKEGILSLTLPKSEESKPRTISIK